MICDLLALRPISHITQKTLSYLHSTKIEQMTKTMVIFRRGAIFYAAFAAIQYHHKLPSSGSRILATLPLAVCIIYTRNESRRAKRAERGLWEKKDGGVCRLCTMKADSGMMIWSGQLSVDMWTMNIEWIYPSFREKYPPAREFYWSRCTQASKTLCQVILPL